MNYQKSLEPHLLLSNSPFGTSNIFLKKKYLKLLLETYVNDFWIMIQMNIKIKLISE